MGIGMHSAVFAFSHAVILLTVSFFVLFSLAKVEKQALKTFGYAIAALLWIAAALVFGKGLTGHPMTYRMHMWGKMHNHGGKVCNQALGSQTQAPEEMPAK